MEGPALGSFLLGLLVSPLLSFQEDPLEWRHDTRLVKKTYRVGVENFKNFVIIPLRVQWETMLHLYRLVIGLFISATYC